MNETEKDAVLAVERERIAQAIEAERRKWLAFPPAWYSAMDRAARIARTEPDQ